MKPVLWLTAIATLIPFCQTLAAQADELEGAQLTTEGTMEQREDALSDDPTSPPQQVVIPLTAQVASPEVISVDRPSSLTPSTLIPVDRPSSLISSTLIPDDPSDIREFDVSARSFDPPNPLNKGEPSQGREMKRFDFDRPNPLHPNPLHPNPLHKGELSQGRDMQLLAQAATEPAPSSDSTTDPLASEPLEPLDESEVRSEVGELQPFTAQTPQKSRPQPTVQLLLRSSAYTSSNITALRDFSPSDTVFVNSAMLLATPKLGESTRLIASASGGLTKFASLGDSNYNHVGFNVAIQQRITEGTYAQLGWLQESLYRAEGGDRLLRDNSLQIILGRQDQIAKKLRLDTTYDLRASFTDRDDQSRLTHSLGTRLRYDVSPQLQTALEYRLNLKDYTRVDRFDTEHQVSALATYSITPNLFVMGNVSYIFGRSSNPDNNPNNLSIGISLGANIPLL
ncbi:MAG: outer membrane beta-barrel protein [Synechococcales bacterium]|nr:outer membrane beta-barrel protein [Synechococcales bacterium]